MTDFFGNQYWPGRFWTVNYFQGGDLPEGAMQAALSGAASVASTLSSTGAAIESERPRPPLVYGGSLVPRRRDYRLRTKPGLIAVYADASIEARSGVAATLTASAHGAAAIRGAGYVSAIISAVDHNTEADNTFWLMAA